MILIYQIEKISFKFELLQNYPHEEFKLKIISNDIFPKEEIDILIENIHQFVYKHTFNVLLES